MFSRQWICWLLFAMILATDPAYSAASSPADQPLVADKKTPAFLDQFFQNRAVDNQRQSSDDIPVEVEGNQRVQHHAIISRLQLSKHLMMDDQATQKAVHTLAATGLFKDVSVRFVNGVLKIKVEENPAVHQIAFEGNRVFTENQLLQQCSGVKPRHVLSVASVREAVDTMQNAYRAMGYYAAVVKPNLVYKDANRVDLVFVIQEGQKAEIRKIVLVGNRHISTKYLRRFMESRERMTVAFLAKVFHGSRFIFNPDTAQQDQQRLIDVYVTKGYLDANVSTALVELDPSRTKVLMTYNIVEGPRYRFGRTKIVSECPKDVPVAMAKAQYNWKPGHWFNIKAVEACARRMTAEIEKAGHPFYTVEVQKIIKDQTVDVVLMIKPINKRYVGRINITGNTVTNDQVIRRALNFQEGDAITGVKHKNSTARLQRLDMFDAVEIVVNDEEGSDRGDVTVRVKEKKSHTAIKAGAQYNSVEGWGVNLEWLDRNVMGTGNTTSISGIVSQSVKGVNASLMAPHCFDRNMTCGLSMGYNDIKNYTKDDLTSKGSYTVRSASTNVNLSYALTDRLTQTWSYSPSIQNIRDMENGGPTSLYILENVKGHETIFCSQAQHSLGYSKNYPINDHILGTGYTISNSVAGLGGDTQFAINTASLNTYYTFGVNNAFRLRADFSVSALSKLGYVRFNNTMKLGGLLFPGFDSTGIGPRDARTGESLGGKFLYVGSLKLDFPLPSTNELPLMGCAHVHVGSLWGTIFDPIPDHPIISVDQQKRVSAGMGFFAAVPVFGKMGFVYSVPIVKNKVDRINCFELVISKEF